MIHPERCPSGPCFACRLDLGHPDWAPRVFGGGTTDRALEHAYCNRAAGVRLGMALRRARRNDNTSRRW
jgi:hypothetical protein